MKLYNPFKLHIVKDGNQNYFIRCWFLGWMYLTYYNEFSWGKHTYVVSGRSYDLVKKHLDQYKAVNQKIKIYERKAKIEKFVDK